MRDPQAVPTAAVLRGRVVDRDGDLARAAVVLQEGRIAWRGPETELPAQWHETGHPAGWPDGLTLLPGLVDLHCHGAAGAEFGPERAAGSRAAEHHHRSGSTAVYASLVSASPAALQAGVQACTDLWSTGLVEGIHLEGPFLSMARRGAQDPAALTDSDDRLIQLLVRTASAAGRSALAQMTCAPERCAPGVVDLLAAAGALAALGHTDCDQAQAADFLIRASRAAPGGRALVTHLFNGMPPLHHRAPGPVAAALSAAARGEAVLEVIGDGVHLDPATVRMVFDLVGPFAVALITDAMAACGMPQGRYFLGGQDVVVRGRTARLADGGSIAGGVATLLEVVRGCVGVAGVPLRDAVIAASATPADVMGRADIGSLRPGSRADVLLVDEQLSPRLVLRGGRCLTLSG